MEAFDAADAYYFKSMARTQRLRAVRNAAHTDLSAREVDAACGAVEHLLHILRAQRRAVASAAEAEAALAVVADATEALRADGVPPPQRATREWTVRQRDTLDGLVAAAAAAKLVHKAVSAAESTPMLRPGSSAAGAAAATLAKVSDTFAAARSTLDPFVTPAIRANEGDISGDAGVGVGVSGESAWSAPALATRSLRDALAANFETMKTRGARGWNPPSTPRRTRRARRARAWTTPRLFPDGNLSARSSRTRRKTRRRSRRRVSARRRAREGRALSGRETCGRETRGCENRIRRRGARRRRRSRRAVLGRGGSRRRRRARLGAKRQIRRGRTRAKRKRRRRVRRRDGRRGRGRDADDAGDGGCVIRRDRRVARSTRGGARVPRRRRRYPR